MHTIVYQAALKRRGLSTRDLARAIAEFQKMEGVRIGTLIGVNEDGLVNLTASHRSQPP